MPEGLQKPTRRAPLTKRERERKIKQIYREMEAKKRELGLRAPVITRGPVFYFVVVMVLLMIGGAVIQAAGKGGGGRTMRDAKLVQAEKSVAALAEALGRYRFHCGQYPTAEEGLEALALKRSVHEGWMGPYIPKMLPDPWKRAYVYEPAMTNQLPVVLSLGPDGVRGTADDIRPAPELFTKPFTDTTWTNNWAPFQMRGYIIVPNKAAKAALQESLEKRK